MTAYRASFIPLAAIAWLCSAAPASAQGFNAIVSPPRFEISATAGVGARHVVEISNAAPQPARYRVRTSDWSLGTDYGVTFHDGLRPGSCRPWVAIERNELLIPGGARIRFRFEVTPPADTPPGECRFALMIEGDEPAVAGGDAFRIPVRGRIGVIVYVAVGDAAPKLEILKAEVATVAGKRVPALLVRNTGNAHGRIGGFLSGTDAQGRELEFAASSFPILPGETRLVELSAQSSASERVDVTLPVTVSGTLEWQGARVPFEHRFE